MARFFMEIFILEMIRGGKWIKILNSSNHLFCGLLSWRLSCILKHHLNLVRGCISNITRNSCINVNMWCIPLKANIFFQLMVKVGHLRHLKRAPGSQEWAAASTRADKGGPPTTAGPMVTQTPSGLAVSMDMLLEAQTKYEGDRSSRSCESGGLWCLFLAF